MAGARLRGVLVHGQEAGRTTHREIEHESRRGATGTEGFLAEVPGEAGAKLDAHAGMGGDLQFNEITTVNGPVFGSLRSIGTGANLLEAEAIASRRRKSCPQRLAHIHGELRTQCYAGLPERATGPRRSGQRDGRAHRVA